jgi:heavy metal translocating P-type ATPase
MRNVLADQFGSGPVVPGTAVATLALGGAMRLAGLDDIAHLVLLLGLIACGSPIVWRTARHAFRRHFATDIVASLAIIGAIVTGQPYAGLIVVLMQSGGEALERFAAGRASAALAQLEAEAPHEAWRRAPDGSVVKIRADDIGVDDTLMIRPGDVIPCDCLVIEGISHVDTARITGEPLPRRAIAGARLVSGMHNLEGALTVRALARAAESQYAQIVALVRSAQESKAPLQRIADRYAVWFTPVTLAVCAVTWFTTHDALRVLAILTVATPCPLILATPVAIVGGISRAAKRQVILRDGAALEGLADIDTIAVDKTGTMTTGTPEVLDIHPQSGFTADEALRLAASLEQVSAHVVARALVEEARWRGIDLGTPSGVAESAGEGISGLVGDRRVAVGGREFSHRVAREPGPALDPGGAGGRLVAWIVIDGRHAAQVTFDDRARKSVGDMMSELKALGITRAVMLSGDDDVYTRAVAAKLGITEVRGGLLPAQKARYVEEMRRSGHRVLMVGDGTNDAPVLATADVGIALASARGGISAEAADAVSLSGDLTAVTDTVRIAKRSLAIARQSIRVGLGLSVVGMGFAAAGFIGPVAGALIQEGIDLAVILNALRAAGAPRGERARGA